MPTSKMLDLVKEEMVYTYENPDPVDNSVNTYTFDSNITGAKLLCEIFGENLTEDFCTQFSPCCTWTNNQC